MLYVFSWEVILRSGLLRWNYLKVFISLKMYEKSWYRNFIEHYSSKLLELTFHDFLQKRLQEVYRQLRSSERMASDGNDENDPNVDVNSLG